MRVTGQTNSSRLGELKKFIVTTNISKQYLGNGSWSNDGVDYSQVEYDDELGLINVTYYIGGIKYVDYVLDSITTFEFNSQGTGNSINFIDRPYYKDPKKENIISLPKLDNDVLIVRPQISVFENNYLLEYINNMLELETFAGGNYFNVVNNI